MQTTKSAITSWNMGTLLFRCATSRIMDPRPYPELCQQREFFLYCPWEEANLAALCSALDFLNRHHDEATGSAVTRYLGKKPHTIAVTLLDATAALAASLDATAPSKALRGTAGSGPAPTKSPKTVPGSRARPCRPCTLPWP